MKRVESRIGVLGGKPVIKGTRVPVYLILELLGVGLTIEDILKEYPELTKEDVLDAIKFASKLAKVEIIDAISP
ncbi:MAG TPA: DUF433 domain-containing protein [Thermococcus sp.]|uniref:DUF433 domain-containing protein n=1 Tax=Thermococcus sp. TaxID=35749 RepID=UPI000F1C075E|nr:DUF433 domain-containing protein [Thermococcus sp.]MCD6140777.1 DUF433 domain-containing protein [Thermococcus sp.]MCD6143628.1 DUF433 domain-containing protein [Thermococcus sp.]RLF75125.1 MAG: antitoxin [Thermococci archaeon]HDH44468.1 DUF433 domain-containing protein [Thermococcus sp.]